MNTTNTQTNQAFFDAILRADLDLVAQLYEEGCSINIVDGEKRTPLHICAIAGHTDVAMWLIGRGIVVNARDKFGLTALHLACFYNKVDILRVLLDSQSANINALSKRRFSPLMIAAWFNFSEVAQLLLESNVDADLHSEDGFCAIHYAIWNGHLEVFQQMQALGVDIKIKTEKGLDILDIARIQHHQNLMSYLAKTDLNHSEIVSFRPARLECKIAEDGLPFIYEITDINDDANLIALSSAESRHMEHTENTTYDEIRIPGTVERISHNESQISEAPGKQKNEFEKGDFDKKVHSAVFGSDSWGDSTGEFRLPEPTPKLKQKTEEVEDDDRELKKIIADIESSRSVPLPVASPIIRSGDAFKINNGRQSNRSQVNLRTQESMYKPNSSVQELSVHDFSIFKGVIDPERIDHFAPPTEQDIYRVIGGQYVDNVLGLVVGNILAMLQIPYQIHRVMHGTVSPGEHQPTFTFFDRNGDVIVWEMLSYDPEAPEHREHWEQTFLWYQKNGFNPGTNFFMTYIDPVKGIDSVELYNVAHSIQQQIH